MNPPCLAAIAFLLALLCVRNWLLRIVAAGADIADELEAERAGHTLHQRHKQAARDRSEGAGGGVKVHNGGNK